MHGHHYPPCAGRLAAHRERRDLGLREVAAHVGLPEAWLRDLETFDEEMYCDISLAQLQRLAQLLSLSVADLLLADPAQMSGDRVPFAGVVDRLRGALAATGESAEAFGVRVGWEVDRVLEQPVDRWRWCAEELADIAAALGINWAAALPAPHEVPPHDVRPG